MLKRKISSHNVKLIIAFALTIIAVCGSVSYGQVSKKPVMKTDSLVTKEASSADSSKPVLAKSVVKHLVHSSLLTPAFSQNKLHKKQLEATDYRFTEEFLAEAANVFIKKLGAGGMPTGVNLYGLGATSTVFLNDGINILSGLTNFTNLHLFQSESIDSIEVMPLSRGFLLGNTNIAAVNLISRETSTGKPYSRLRYYQAPSNEGLIDGTFTISPFKKTNAFIELTNHGADSYYSNSKFSNWMANVRLSYLLSPGATIRVNYKYVKSTAGLNGGVDLEATQTRYPNFALDELVYDNRLAVVKFSNRYITNTNNFFSAALLARLIENFPSELSFYYKDDLAEFRQNISGDVTDNVLPVFHDNKTHTVGARFRQDFTTENFDFVSITSAERNKFNSPLLEKEITQTSFSSSAVATLKLADDRIIPSGFAKYLNQSHISYFGFGADAIIKLNSKFSLYAGISHFEKPISQLEQSNFLNGLQNKSQQIQNAEVKASADFGFCNLTAGYFLVNNDNELQSAFIKNEKLNDEAFFVKSVKSTTHGLSLQAQFTLWKIHLNTNSTLYLSKDERIRNGFPQFSSNGGVYYIDTLFNNNLKLKTGFNYYSYGSRYEQRFDFEKGISSSYFYDSSSNDYYLINTTEFTPSFQIDFFLAGRIQDSAIIYFVWENLLNSKYFVVPYYPMQPRGLRFGVAWEFLD